MSKLWGDLGEDVAAEFLAHKGYVILHRQFHSKFGEIDIVANSPDNTLVFVEVKHYKARSVSDSRFAITHKKRRCLIQTARFFILRFNVHNQDMRFDLITVENKVVTHHLEHIISIDG